MNNKEIIIVGRGINPSRHLTIDGIRALKRANAVFGIEPDQRSWNQIVQEFQLPPIQQIGDLYRFGAMDLDNYQRFVSYIVEASLRYTTCAFLVGGHPLLGVTFVSLLKQHLPQNTTLTIIEGISSFDTMLVNLQLDPLEQGTVILDANRALLFEYHLETALNYFIYHISSVLNSHTDYNNPSPGNNIAMLKQYLTRFYSSDTIIYLCHSRSQDTLPDEQIPTTIEYLDRLQDQVHYGTSLYIPAQTPTRLNKSVLNTLRSAQ